MRDPANELYDAACVLVDAAHRLREAAERPGTEIAVAATLGCLEAMLAEVTVACQALSDRSDRRLRTAADVLGAPARQDQREFDAQFARTVAALSEAAEACDRTRSAVGPTLAALSIG